VGRKIRLANGTTALLIRALQQRDRICHNLSLAVADRTVNATVRGGFLGALRFADEAIDGIT